MSGPIQESDGQNTEKRRTSPFYEDMHQILKTQRAIAFHRVFAAIAGGALPGLFLSQAWYWSQRTEDPEGWFYKTMEEWTAETGMTRREQETSRRYLRKQGLLEEGRRGVHGTLYFRLLPDPLLAALRLSMAESANVQCTKTPMSTGGNEQSTMYGPATEQRTKAPMYNGGNGQFSSEITPEISTERSAEIPLPHPSPVAGEGPQAPDGCALGEGTTDALGRPVPLLFETLPAGAACATPEPSPLEAHVDALIARAAGPHAPDTPRKVAPEGQRMPPAVAACPTCDWRGYVEVLHADGLTSMVPCPHDPARIAAGLATHGWTLMDRLARLELVAQQAKGPPSGSAAEPHGTTPEAAEPAPAAPLPEAEILPEPARTGEQATAPPQTTWERLEDLGVTLGDVAGRAPPANGTHAVREGGRGP